MVDEDERGGYLQVRPEFLNHFRTLERNPNFEVYDSHEGSKRFVVAKSSRLPDDEDLADGRYGIDFHRGKPSLHEALGYAGELPRALESMNRLANMAFAASTEEEYIRKSSALDGFHSYIWGSEPANVWVAPHSGRVAREPDDVLPWPEQVMDAFTAGVAASCAFNDQSRPSKRLMISIHSSSFLGPVLELGGFGMVGAQELAAVAKRIEVKYHRRAQALAGEHRQYFALNAVRWLEHIENKRGTLNPQELSRASTADRRRVELIAKGLRLYGKEISMFALDEFREAMEILNKTGAPLISTNYTHPASHTGRLLGLSEKIGDGLLHSALNIECSKVYSAREPELVVDMILEIKNDLFD